MNRPENRPFPPPHEPLSEFTPPKGQTIRRYTELRESLLDFKDVFYDGKRMLYLDPKGQSALTITEFGDNFSLRTELYFKNDQMVKHLTTFATNCAEAGSIDMSDFEDETRRIPVSEQDLFILNKDLVRVLIRLQSGEKFLPSKR